MSPYHSHVQGRRMSSLAHSCFRSSGVLFHSPGSLSPSLKILGIIPKEQTYKRALQRRYLERTCVHACIQLCTRGYTVVYTRVHSSLLGRRYSLGISRLGHRYFYLRRMLLDNLALALWRFHALALSCGGNYIFLVSLLPRMKVALFLPHKIDTYTIT